MTTIINLYGGPGTGKSTTAALMFAALKQRGVNAELVQEVAKTWAWEDRRIAALDQFQIFGEQLRRESVLLGKVDVVVTDGPLLLGEFFSRWYAQHDIANAIQKCVETYNDELRNAGHHARHVFLKRTKPYNPNGRYQKEEEARRMDLAQEALVFNRFGAYDALDTDEGEIRDYVSEFNLEVNVGDVWK